MINKIKIEGSINVYFKDVKLYEELVESNEEYQKRIKEIIDEMRGNQEEGFPDSPNARGG
jgi:hypothetical protein